MATLIGDVDRDWPRAAMLARKSSRVDGAHALAHVDNPRADCTSK
ncbi:MAG: hypothetical protein AB7L94_08205 [Kofleriaceae bacterium]